MMRPAHHRHPFTFAELLAAMVLVAVVLPVAMHTIHVAGRVSRTSLARETAGRLADAKLHELVLTGDWQNAEAGAEFEDWPDYRWEVVAEDWAEDDASDVSMTLLTVLVSTTAMGSEQQVSLSTLVGGSE